ncbi:MAG: pyruvate synthase subunit PorD, partial [Desulfobacterales bacterium]|nr:pyruvate synthase subunit PorD [Desulfobacterales bacterium]
ECGWCYIYCPSGCRKVEEGHFSADLDYCKGCGVCARFCPARAIMMVREED